MRAVRPVRRGGSRPSLRRSSCLASCAAARVAAARWGQTARARVRRGALPLTPSLPLPPPAGRRRVRKAHPPAAAPVKRARRGAARRVSWRRCSALTGSRASTLTLTLALALTLTLTLALTLTLTLTQVKSFDDFWERHCANLGQVAFGSFITGAPYATISGAIVQLAIVQLVTVSGAVVSHSTVSHNKWSHGTVSLRRLPILRHPTPRHLVRVGRGAIMS